MTAHNVNTNEIKINGKTVIDKNMNIICNNIACESVVSTTGTTYFAFKNDRTESTPRDIQIKGNVDFDDSVARFILLVIISGNRPDPTVAKDGQIHVDHINVVLNSDGKIYMESIKI